MNKGVMIWSLFYLSSGVVDTYVRTKADSLFIAVNQTTLNHCFVSGEEQLSVRIYTFMNRRGHQKQEITWFFVYQSDKA